jgi:hypothetical protein
MKRTKRDANKGPGGLGLRGGVVAFAVLISEANRRAPYSRPSALLKIQSRKLS